MKRIYKIVQIIVLIALLTSCAGTGDWSFELSNGYEVWHINSDEILVVYTGEDQNAAEIPGFVKEFAYNDRYVFTRNVKDIKQNNILDEVYYILDMQEKTLYGPIGSLEELTSKTESLEIKMPTVWHRTSPSPKGAG